MKKLFDEEGNEVEALTPEEAEAELNKRAAEKADEKIASYISEHPEQEDVINMKKELDETKEKLSKLEGKDLNFGNLRKQKDEAEKTIKSLNEKLDKEIGGIKDMFFKDTYDATLNSLSEGDEELKKKIEFNFKRISDPTDTKEMIQKKLRDAYTLSTGSLVGNNGIPISSSGAPIKRADREGVTISKDLAGLAGKLGLSDEDLKNHGIKIN